MYISSLEGVTVQGPITGLSGAYITANGINVQGNSIFANTVTFETAMVAPAINPATVTTPYSYGTPSNNCTLPALVPNSNFQTGVAPNVWGICMTSSYAFGIRFPFNTGVAHYIQGLILYSTQPIVLRLFASSQGNVNTTRGSPQIWGIWDIYGVYGNGDGTNPLPYNVTTNRVAGNMDLTVSNVIDPTQYYVILINNVATDPIFGSPIDIRASWTVQTRG